MSQWFGNQHVQRTSQENAPESGLFALAQRWLLQRRNGHIQRIVGAVLLDLLILWASYLVALVVRTPDAPLASEQSLYFIAFATVLTFTTLYFLGVYRRLWSRTSGHGIVLLFNAVVLAVAPLLILDFIIRPRPLPLSVIVVANALAFAGFVGVRYRSRLITGLVWRWEAIWHRRFPRIKTRVLIIGAGRAGQELAWRLKYRSPEPTYDVVGFIDDDPQKLGLYVEGSKVLGNRTDIVPVVERLNVDLIVVALHQIGGVDFRNILTYCEMTNARIKVLPNLFEMINSTRQATALRDVKPEDLIGRSTITRHEAVDLAPVTSKVVLITGAAGTIGAELSVQMATYSPVKVILVDNNESGLHDLCLDARARFPHVCFIPVLADVTEDEPLRSAFVDHQPQIVFHAAAYKHVPMLEDFPGVAIHNNIEGTRRVMELAHASGAERFVLISSDKAVNPSSVMGATKRVCELMVHAYAQRGGGTRYTAVRFGNVLGSRGSVVPIFHRQIASGGPVTVTDPDMTRYFMSIPEAVNLVIHAACLTKGDDIFLLKMGEVVRIVELAERMIRLRGLRPYKDIEIRFTGLRPGEKLHEELYGEGETPEATQHPHIVLLNSWSCHFDGSAFLEASGALSHVRYARGEQALRALRALVDMNERAGVAGD